MQRIIITFILICSCCHLSATRNEKLSFTLDSLLDNRSKIFKQKEASINTYKGIMDKDKSTATLLSIYLSMTSYSMNTTFISLIPPWCMLTSP